MNCKTFEDMQQNCPYSPIWNYKDLNEAKSHLSDETNCKYWVEIPKTKTLEKLIEPKFNNSEKVDNVNHPEHYTSHPSGIECIEVTRHYCFSIGNAIKYLWRAGLKKDASLSDNQKEIEDLKKAIWYIKDRIKQLGGEK